MKYIKYFFQFCFITFLLIIFKILGLNFSRIIASKLFLLFGPFFRSRKIIQNNISLALPKSSDEYIELIIQNMWLTYGKILAEYIFIKRFRKIKSEYFLEIKGQKILDEVKILKKPVIFVSGHFDNFELMAMYLEKSGIDLAAIYRPLNNLF